MTDVRHQTLAECLYTGNALLAQQRWAEAGLAYRQALAYDANHAPLWRAIAITEQNLGRFDAAHEAFERSLALVPGDRETIVRFAFLLSEYDQPMRAIELVQALLKQEPKLVVAWMMLGHANSVAGDFTAAENAYRQAAELSPLDPAGLFQLADVLLKQWSVSEAEATTRQLLAQHPEHADAWALLGLILRAKGQHAESLASLRRAIDLKPNPQHHSKLLAGLQFVETTEAGKLLEAHREWDLRHGRFLLPTAPPVAGHRHLKPLRLGFVSADFARHPVGFLVLPALEHLDKRQVWLACYSDRAVEDAYAARFRTAADAWHKTGRATDEQLAEQIRADEIDILFDLAGHFGERLGVFARKAAPMQVSWLGYVGTTGLGAMDYLLADWHHVRSGEETWYREKVLRLPHGYACYAPPDDAPEVSRLPALASGVVTFGCLNNSAKFSQPMYDAWTKILREVRNSRLFLKYGWLSDRTVAGLVRAEFERRGVGSDRIIIEGAAPHREYLASYSRVDLALDTQPYSGGLTTCESLWMGVPVVTVPGKTFAGRHATSYLSSAGCEPWIARDLDDYAGRAVHWADRLDELAELRTSLREQVRQSRMCDAKRFAADFVEVLQQGWRQLISTGAESNVS